METKVKKLEDPSPVQDEERRAQPRQRWVEPVVALLMAFATLGTAWCSYQSAAWTRQANRAMHESNALERRAGVLNIQGMQAATIHVAMFMQLLAAHQAANYGLRDFYAGRFPPEARDAYEKWVAQNPFENANADTHPFVPHLYELRGSKEAAELTQTAATFVEKARAAGNVSGEYLANTVLFAAVLFFANAAGKFEQRRVRVVSFAFALAIFSFAILRITLLPR